MHGYSLQNLVSKINFTGMAKKASHGNEEYHTLQVELLAASCTMNMEVRNVLSLSYST